MGLSSFYDSFMLPKSSHPLIWSQKDFISSSDTLSENPVLIWIQNSFSVARKLLKDLRREAKTREDWLVRWNCSYCRFTHSFSRNQSCPERVLSVLKTTSLLGNSLLLASLRLLIQSFFFVKLPAFFLNSNRRYQLWLPQQECDGLPKPESSSRYYLPYHGQCS